MRKFLFVLSFMIFISGCDKGGGGNNSVSGADIAAANAPTSGKTYFAIFSASAGDRIILRVIFGPTDAVTTYEILWKASGALIYRKQVGTYITAGNRITLRYSYETCSPVGTENMGLRKVGQEAMIAFGTPEVEHKFWDEAYYHINGLSLSGSMTEDTRCNLIAKGEGKKSGTLLMAATPIVLKDRLPATKTK